MSAEAAIQFFDKIKGDSQLEQEMVQAVEGKDEKESAEIVAKLAATKGYELTSDELLAEMQKRMKDLEKSNEAGEELSDEQLEAVSGGLLFSGSLAIGGLTMAAGFTLLK